MSLETVSIVVAILVAVIGWLQVLRETKEKRQEKIAREKAEAELAMIKRRATGPYLHLNQSRFNWLYFDNGKPGEIGMRAMGHGDMLDSVRDEVAKDVPEGHEIFLLIRHTGEDANEVVLKLDDACIQLRREIDIDDAHGFLFISYPYKPAKHGHTQKITLEFLSSSGVRDTHTYETMHGKRILRRIDPQ